MIKNIIFSLIRLLPPEVSHYIVINLLRYIPIKKKNIIVKIDKRLIRPNEVNYLKGNNMKAKKILKWTPKINYIKLVKEMVASDLENLSS